jgi:glycosyltransferase involved in cell wall biosynthesis
MNVAIAHEWLLTYGGSERCVEQMLEEFNVTKLLTALVRPDALPPSFRTARPTLLQHLPGAVDHHEWTLPLLPFAWAALPAISDVDIVISSSHSCAKSVRIAPGIPHVCYCHTPMRYAWHWEEERKRLPAALQPAGRLAMSAFRRWDRWTAQNVDRMVANSSAVAERIRRFYGLDSAVVHPPVKTDFFRPGEGERHGFLHVGRLVSYKRADLVVEAFRGLPHELTVVGTGQLENELRATAPGNVRFIRSVTDEELRELYRSSLGLVFPGVEDFGIVMAEAQACGTPVIASAAGGARDIIRDDSGWLLEKPTIESIREAVALAAREPFQAEDIAAAAAARFSEERFRTELRAVVEETLASKAR